MHLSDYDAYVNITGGIRMNEPAIDLAIVLALISSFKERPISDGVICFGEVGLSGEVRGVSQPRVRIAEAIKLGFNTCIMPAVSLKGMEPVKGINLIGVQSVGDAADAI